jgi:hypothetical protein
LREAAPGNGRATAEPYDRTFGLAIFEAPDGSAARAFMAADPAVAEEIMTPELHPYRVTVRGR